MKSGKKIEASDFAGIGREVRNVSDRSAAIVLASLVERELEHWIVGVLPRQDKKTVDKLLERDGSLNSFYGKIHLGYALGLYDESARENLDIIRRVRNIFAHTPQAIDFETDEVRELVQKLTTTSSTDPDLTTLSEHRRKFTAACGMVVTKSRFEPIREKIELMRSVLEAIGPHVTGELKKHVPDAADKLGDLVKAIEKLK